jgi:hypothetical protein
MSTQHRSYDARSRETSQLLIKVRPAQRTD